MSAVGNDYCSNPIFVTGYMHSGTTMLRGVLTRNPMVFTGRGETRFFQNLPLLCQEFPNLGDDRVLDDYVVYLIKLAVTNYNTMHLGDRSQVDLGRYGVSSGQIESIQAEARGVRDHARLFALVFDRLTSMSGKLRWLEKTPNQMMYVDKILRVVPEALFVELVRDPRDVLASKSIRSTREWQERLRPEQREAWRSSAFDPLWDTVGWQSAIRAGDEARKRHPERVYRVKYEDLVANAAEETEKICDFLGLEFNAEMLDVYVTNTTTQGDPQRRGIRREAVGKWQRTLAPEAVALCQWVAKREMDRLGYPRVPVSRTTYAKTPVLMVKSGVEFVSRLYRRWRLRGTGYVRNALSSYWQRLLVLTRGQGAA